MAQVLEKPFECLGCGNQIRISKIDNAPADQKKKWLRFELDGKTEHVCHGNKKAQQQQTQANQLTLQQQHQQQPQEQQPTTTLAETIARLESKMDVLLTEVRILRMGLAAEAKKQS
jgi:hypothetical protein